MKTVILVLIVLIAACGCAEEDSIDNFPPVEPLPVCMDDEYRNPENAHQCIKITQCKDYPELTDEDRETLVNPTEKRRIEGWEILAWWKAIDTAIHNGSLDPVLGDCLHDQLPEIIYADFLDCGTEDPQDLIDGTVNDNTGCVNDGFYMIEPQAGFKTHVHESTHLIQFLVLGFRGHPCQFFYPDHNSPGFFDVIGFENDGKGGLGEEFLC